MAGELLPDELFEVLAVMGQSATALLRVLLSMETAMETELETDTAMEFDPQLAEGSQYVAVAAVVAVAVAVGVVLAEPTATLTALLLESLDIGVWPLASLLLWRCI